jgi:hypothetical protein
MVENVIAMLLAAAWLVLVIFAMTRTLKSTVPTLEKTIWVIVLLIPVVGVAVWLILGPGRGRISQGSH